MSRTKVQESHVPELSDVRLRQSPLKPSMPDAHQKPNILVTGTPGVGKSTLAAVLAEELGLELVSVGDIVEQNGFTEGHDPVLQTAILDEDALLDHLEMRLDSAEGGCVVDYHAADFFPERWFDLVVVLRAETERLYDRLAARGYSETKLQNNVQAEIFGTILEEARESYDASIVQELPSNSPEDEEDNVRKLREWAQQWHAAKGAEAEGME